MIVPLLMGEEVLTLRRRDEEGASAGGLLDRRARHLLKRGPFDEGFDGHQVGHIFTTWMGS
jgi:hypothetical protein